jgi:iron(III) transport system permease protein
MAGSIALGRGSSLRRLARLALLYRAQWAVALLLALLAFLVLYPIGTVIVLTFSAPDASGVFGTIPWQRAFDEPGMARSIVNTLKIVLAVQCISLPVAVGIAWLLGRTNVPGRRWIEFCFWILFFLPSLGVTTGWLLFLDPHFGLLNRWIVDSGLAREAPFSLYSVWGIVFAHITTYGIAVKVMLLTPAFRNLDAAIEEASYICGAGKLRTLAGVVVPILLPAIAVVLLMSIIRGLEAFEIELVLGTPINFDVYSTKIYRLMSGSPPEYMAAGLLATSILAVVLPLIILQRWISTRRSYAVLTGRASQASVDLGRWRWPAFFLLAAIVCFMSILPLGLLLAGSFMKLFGFFDLPQIWTLDHWVKAMDDDTFLSGLRNTLILGLGTAACAVAVFSVVAYCAVRVSSRLRAGLDVVTWLPLTIPGIVLGFGYLNMALNVPMFAMLYGTLGALVLVCFLSSMTLGVQVLKVNMLQIGADVEEAARVAGSSWAHGFRRVILPLTVPALAVIAVMVFAATIRNVSTIILLSRGDTRVLSVLQVEFLSNGSLGPASVVGTLIVLMSLAAALVVRLVSGRFGVQTRG